MNEVDLDLVEPLPLLPLLPDIHDPSEILIQDIGKVKRNRGPGIKWVDIETENHEEIIYESFDDVLAHVDLLNVSKLGEKSKKVFIYKCKFKNCPYKIKFMKRYDARYDSSSTGTHSHIGDTEEGGNSDDNMRGLDILQKKIVKEGFNLGITSIAQILKYFRIQRAKREAQEKFPTDPDKRKLSNYVASLKKKNSEVSESLPMRNATHAIITTTLVLLIFPNSSPITFNEAVTRDLINLYQICSFRKVWLRVRMLQLTRILCGRGRKERDVLRRQMQNQDRLQQSVTVKLGLLQRRFEMVLLQRQTNATQIQKMKKSKCGKTKTWE